MISQLISQSLYRAYIVDAPEFEEYIAWDERYGEREEALWERPVGWEPDADYVERFKSNKFFEPNTDKWFKSRSSAKARVDLLNSMGYVAIVQRSAPVQWPKDGQERVPENANVAEALRIVQDAGFTITA